MATELSQKITLRGGIPQADQDKMTFELQQIYGGRVAVPIPERHRDTVIEAFNGYRNGVKVLVQGVGCAESRNGLSSLESVEHISTLDPRDVPARLDEFRKMRNGWLEGGGLAPNHDGLDWLASSFAHYFPGEDPLPHTYPTEDGGVRMEWSSANNAMILEIDLITHQGEWLWFDRDSDNDYERMLDMDATADWKWLVLEIRGKHSLSEE